MIPGYQPIAVEREKDAPPQHPNFRRDNLWACICLLACGAGMTAWAWADRVAPAVHGWLP